jgi:hypothetical protein
MKQLIVAIVLSSILYALNVFCVDVSAKQKNETDYKGIVQAIFPDEKIVIQEEERYHNVQTVMRIDKTRSIPLTRPGPEESIKICPIKTEENGDKIFSVALRYDVDVKGIYDPWNAKIIMAVLRQNNETLKLLNKSDIPLKEGIVEKGGYYVLRDIRTIELLNRKMAVLEYEYGDGESRPRGYHEITNFVDFDADYKPKVVWYEQTGYDMDCYGDSVDTKVTYKFKKDKDGYDQIFVEKTTVEKYARVWDGSEFVAPQTYPPESFSKRMERRKIKEEKENAK